MPLALFSLRSLRRTVARFSLTYPVLVWRYSAKKKAQPFGQTFFLVDPGRENWNCIFVEIERLSEKLEQLGIDDFREADDV